MDVTKLPIAVSPQYFYQLEKSLNFIQNTNSNNNVIMALWFYTALFHSKLQNAIGDGQSAGDLVAVSRLAAIRDFPLHNQFWCIYQRTLSWYPRETDGLRAHRWSQEVGCFLGLNLQSDSVVLCTSLLVKERWESRKRVDSRQFFSLYCLWLDAT